ncbi:MAG TPA: hypothetical protein VJV97_09250 [Gemmatimonadaceae bacterium]|nr:hypothetical protein [Gemmatimonadaceae bacterium]
MNAVTIGPVLRSVVGGKHAFGAAFLSVKTPVTIPGADVQYAFAPEVDRVQVLPSEAPYFPVTGDIGCRDRVARPFPKSNS